MLSDRDYKQKYQEMLRLTMKNKTNLHHADTAKPIIKDFTKKPISTDFLSKQDKVFKQKYVQTLQAKMNIGNIKDNSSNEIEQGVMPQVEDSRSQGEKLNDKVLQQQICSTNCKNLINDPAESNILFNMLNDDTDLLQFFNDHFPEIKAKYALQKNIKAVFVIQALDKMYQIKLKSNDVSEPLQTNEFYSVFPKREILEALYAKLDEEYRREQQGDASVDAESVADSMDRIEAMIHIVDEAQNHNLTPEELRMISEMGLPPAIPDDSDISSIVSALSSFDVKNLQQVSDIVLNSDEASPTSGTSQQDLQEPQDPINQQEQQDEEDRWKVMVQAFKPDDRLLQEYTDVKSQYLRNLEDPSAKHKNIEDFKRLLSVFETEIRRRETEPANSNEPVAEQPSSQYLPKVSVGELNDNDVEQLQNAEYENFRANLDNTLLSIAGYENEYHSLMDELEKFKVNQKDKSIINDIALQLDSILLKKISPDTTSEIETVLPQISEIVNDQEMTEHEKVKTVEKVLKYIKPIKLTKKEEEAMFNDHADGQDQLEKELINQKDHTGSELISVRPNTRDLITPVGQFRLDGDTLYYCTNGEVNFHKMKSKQYETLLKRHTEGGEDGLTTDDVNWVLDLPKNITEFKRYVFENIEDINYKRSVKTQPQFEMVKKSNTKKGKSKVSNTTKAKPPSGEVHLDDDDPVEVYKKAMRNAGTHSREQVNKGEDILAGHGFAVSKKKSSKSNIINNIMKQLIAKR